MFEDLHQIDLYKCIASLAAGLLLGIERELKDKAAGLKTISVICLGATLFSIISLRYDPSRATALAAYIVSGVGFLGAGVIFKDGTNISGLTTAGIIWIAAAVGTAIGFGEVYLSIAFVVISLVLMWSLPLMSSLFLPVTQSRQLTITVKREDFNSTDEVMKSIARYCPKNAQHNITANEEFVEIAVEILIEKKKLRELTDYLYQHPKVVAFSL